MAMAATIPYYTVADLDHFPHDGNRYELLDGVLLVTPAPGAVHQAIALRIATMLMNALGAPGHARIFGPGAVSFPPRTQLEPDVLVVPARFPLSDRWQDYTEHWLAVEVYSPSSRVYDREFKRDAYLALGVREVWLVDRDDRRVEVSRVRGESVYARDAIVWRVPTLALDVRIDLWQVFAGIE